MGRRVYGRHGIKATLAEWVAPQKAPHGQVQAAKRAMSCNGDCGVFRASGQVTTTARAERVYQGREPSLVKGQQSQQEARHVRARFEVADRSRTASAFACVRTRTISASSFGNSSLSTERRGCRMRSQPWGSNSTCLRSASRIRRLMRLRSCAFPRTLPAVSPTRGAAWLSACGARNQLIEADCFLQLAAYAR